MGKDKRSLGDVEFAGKVKTQTFKQLQLKSLMQWEQQNKKPPEGGFSQNSQSEIKTYNLYQLKHWLR